MIEKKPAVGKPADDFIRIQDLWGMFVPRWHWFALSLFAALAIAAFYLLSTPNIYTRTAAILVKDERFVHYNERVLRPGYLQVEYQHQ